MAERTMADEHKAAIAAGRIEAAAVRDCLEALEALQAEPDMTAVEAGFIEHAANYGARKGIAYATWREFGVAADVLNKAGITRGQ